MQNIAIKDPKKSIIVRFRNLDQLAFWETFIASSASWECSRIFRPSSAKAIEPLFPERPTGAGAWPFWCLISRGSFSVSVIRGTRESSAISVLDRCDDDASVLLSRVSCDVEGVDTSTDTTRYPGEGNAQE